MKNDTSLDISTLIENLNHRLLKEPYYIDDKGYICYRSEGKNIPLVNFFLVPKSIYEIYVDSSEIETTRIEFECYLEKDKLEKKIYLELSNLGNIKTLTEKIGINARVFPNTSSAHFWDCLKVLYGKNIQKHKIYKSFGWQKEASNNSWSFIYDLGSELAKAGINDFMLSRFNLKIDKRLSDQDVFKKSLKMLDVADKEITIPLMSFSMLSLLTTPLSSIGHTPKFILMLVGLTGSRKTTLAKLFFELFSRKEDFLQASFRNTKNAMESKGYYYKDQVLNFDDFLLVDKSLESKKMLDTFEHILRVYGDNTSRDRLGYGNKLQISSSPRGLAAVTGESTVYNHSSMARTFMINIKPSNVNLDILTECQDEPLVLPTLVFHYTKWLTNNIDSILDTFTEEYPKLRREYSFFNFHGRLVDAATHLVLSYRLFLNFGKAIKAISEYERHSLSIQGENIIIEHMQKQHEYMKQESIDLMFINAVIDLLNNKKIPLISIGTKAADDALVGWHDAKFIYFRQKTIFQEVSKFYQEKNQSFKTTESHLTREFIKKDIICFEKDFSKGKETKKGTVKVNLYENKKLRVWKFKKDMLFKYSGFDFGGLVG